MEMDTETKPFHSGFFKAGNSLFGKHPAIIRRDDNSMAHLSAGSGEIFNIIADEGFATAQDDNARADLASLSEKFFPFIGCQLAIGPGWACVCPAMRAGKGASLGRLPGEKLEPSTATSELSARVTTRVTTRMTARMTARVPAARTIAWVTLWVIIRAVA